MVICNTINISSSSTSSPRILLSNALDSFSEILTNLPKGETHKLSTSRALNYLSNTTRFLVRCCPNTHCFFSMGKSSPVADGGATSSIPSIFRGQTIVIHVSNQKKLSAKIISEDEMFGVKLEVWRWKSKKIRNNFEFQKLKKKTMKFVNSPWSNL